MSKFEHVQGLIKQADPAADQQFATYNQWLQGRARSDIGNMFLLAGAAGLGGRGLLGLLKQTQAPKLKTRSGPAELPLPYPVMPQTAPGPVLRAADKQATWVDRQVNDGANWLGQVVAGNKATTKPGIPYYMPGMMVAGLGGLAGGWKAMDYTLNAQEDSRRKQELENARSQFHNALMSQYDAPLGGPGKIPSVRAGVKKAEDETMEKVGAVLDELYDLLTAPPLEKQAVGVADVLGAGLGAYGMYALPTAVLGAAAGWGAGVARSDRKVMEAAMRKRERAKFLSQPTELYAVPEPVTHVPQPSAREDTDLLSAA